MRKGVTRCVVLVGIIFAIWLATGANWRINALTANCIETGMTLDEIESILGEPGDHTVHFTSETTFTTLGWRVGQHRWKTNAIEIVVNMNPKTGRAEEVHVHHLFLE